MDRQLIGRLGMVALLILAIVYGLMIVIGFSLPAPLLGLWLIIGAILALLGV